MRFVEDGIRIIIKELDVATSDKPSPKVTNTHEFKSFITNINEGFKYVFKPSTSRLYPLVRYNNIESYYMELSLDFDLLAETQSEIISNKASILSINNQIHVGITSFLASGGSYSAKDAVALTNPTFIIQFNGLVYQKSYKGYITQFDAKPDLEKGYWHYDKKGNNTLFPIAYKVSLKFESSDLSSDPSEKLDPGIDTKIKTAIDAARKSAGSSPLTLAQVVRAVRDSFTISSFPSSTAEQLVVDAINGKWDAKKEDFITKINENRDGFPSKGFFTALLSRVTTEVK